MTTDPENICDGCGYVRHSCRCDHTPEPNELEECTHCQRPKLINTSPCRACGQPNDAKNILFRFWKEYKEEPDSDKRDDIIEKYALAIEDRDAKAREMVEETITKFTPWIEHRVECIRSFDEDAECDCGLTKALIGVYFQ